MNTTRGPVVDEAALERSVQMLLEIEKTVAEGAGAAGNPVELRWAKGFWPSDSPPPVGILPEALMAWKSVPTPTGARRDGGVAPEELLRLRVAAPLEEMGQLRMQASPAALEQLRAQGVEVRRLPDEVLARLKEVAAEVVEASAKADPVAAKVWEQQSAYLKRLYAYAELNEKDIYNIRG